MESLSPIILFVYNRPLHTQQTVEALQKNELAKKSQLFIYSDAPKNIQAIKGVEEVRNYIKKIDGFKEIIIVERDHNWGLANSIIDGVTKIVNEYGRIIVLEDDLVTSPYFLNFMNEGLQMYKDDDQVASIHGYLYPIKGVIPKSFFIKGTDCWGWATWKKEWGIFEKNGKKLLDELKKSGRQKEANFNNTYNYTQMLKDQIKGKVDSWAIRWYMSSFLQNKLTLYPGTSLVANIGMDNSGVHNGTTLMFEVKLLNHYEKLNRIDVQQNEIVRKYFEEYLRKLKFDVFNKICYKFKELIYDKYAKKGD